jgi:4-hydroxy-3-methylbut-2-enyl diphosphate reductase IspH
MPHTLLLSEPRGCCTGVAHAVDVLDAVLDRESPPVYAFQEMWTTATPSTPTQNSC